MGFDRSAVARLIAAHRLSREYRGVYRDGTIVRSHETTVRCALLVAGDGAVLVLQSAAYRDGHLQFPPARPQVAIANRKRRADRNGFNLHRYPTLEDRDIVLVDGLRCSGRARTVLDLAAAARSHADRRALRRALRGAVTADSSVTRRLRSELDRRGTFRGSRLLRTMLEENLDGTLEIRSDLEMDFVTFCSDRGLPIPEMNAVVEGKEVDAAWLLEHVVVELDTYDHHGGPVAFEADRARDEFLRERGWPVPRITRARLKKEPDVVEKQLRDRLGIPLPAGRATGR